MNTDLNPAPHQLGAIFNQNVCPCCKGHKPSGQWLCNPCLVIDTRVWARKSR